MGMSAGCSEMGSGKIHSAMKELSGADKAGPSARTLLENCQVVDQSHCNRHMIVDATDLQSVA